MSDRKAFEVWWIAEYSAGTSDEREWALTGWQAALASERAKRAEPAMYVELRNGAVSWTLGNLPDGKHALYAAPPVDQAKRERVLRAIKRCEECAAPYAGFNSSIADEYLEWAELLREAYL